MEHIYGFEEIMRCIKKYNFYIENVLVGEDPNQEIKDFMKKLHGYNSRGEGLEIENRKTVINNYMYVYLYNKVYNTGKTIVDVIGHIKV